LIRRNAAKVPEKDAEDVPEYMLSIEEWRAKVEQDEINRLAREAKNKLLSQLEVIRNKVTALIEENKTRERNQQLAPEDFVIDPRLQRLDRAASSWFQLSLLRDYCTGHSEEPFAI